MTTKTQKNISEKKHTASTLLISCVDFRLRDKTEKLMIEKFNLLDDYDEVSIPGASLALTKDAHLNWKEMVEEMIDMLRKLHHIKRIILLDHRDCGAFKLIKGSKHTTTRELETQTHLEVMQEAKKSLQSKFSHLEVYTMLLDLDGSVEDLKLN